VEVTVSKKTWRSAIWLVAVGAALAVGLIQVVATDEPKNDVPKKGKPANPLAQKPTLPAKGVQAAVGPRSAAPQGWVRHILTVEPATGFQYRFESAASAARRLRLERGALESDSGRPAEVLAFRAGVYPGDDAKQGGFFTSPDSVPLKAWATILIEGPTSGDFLVCRSLGSWQGLKVTVKLYRENPDGSIALILTQDLTDADEHKFPIP
jgi:hypothetical protein